MINKLAGRPGYLWQMGRVIRELEEAINKRGAHWRVKPDTDFAKPYLILVQLISEAGRRGAMRGNLDWHVMTLMCWWDGDTWADEVLAPVAQGPVKMGYSGLGDNMYRDGERIAISEYADKHGVSFGLIKQRAISGKMLSARKNGERWTVDSAEPFIRGNSYGEVDDEDEDNTQPT